MENLTRYKMETCECNDWNCDKIDAWPDPEGEWVKFSDIKELLQTDAQQLKAEILPILTDALDEFADRKFDRGEYYLKQATAKLSAV